MMMINFENNAHWNMFTADKKELIDVYNNIVERFDLKDENYFLQPDVEIKITVNKNGVLLLWYYPKEIEEENRNCDKTFFQYKIDLYKDDSIPHPDKNVMENIRMLGRKFGQKIIPVLKEKEYIKEVTNLDTILPFVNNYLQNMKKALKEAQIKSIS